jgi:hypothetical protein
VHRRGAGLGYVAGDDREATNLLYSVKVYRIDFFFKFEKLSLGGSYGLNTASFGILSQIRNWRGPKMTALTRARSQS